MAGEDRVVAGIADEAREAIDFISPSETIRHNFQPLRWAPCGYKYLLHEGITLLLHT